MDDTPIEEFCDVCDQVATHKCSGCHQAYYCGAQCQKVDWIEHRDECNSVDDMVDAEVLEELGLHLDALNEPSDFRTVGQEILKSENAEDARQWILEHIGATLKQRFNRRRVRTQKHYARRKTRRERRKTRKANRGKRQAGYATKAKQGSQKAYQKRQQAEQAEDQAQQRTFSTTYQ